MAFIPLYKELGQVRPANTSNTLAYSPPANARGQILLVAVCNTSGADATFRLFVDKDGTTYDETTAIIWDEKAPPGLTQFLQFVDKSGMRLETSSSNLAVRSSVGNALTFTIYGREDITV